MVPGHSNPRPLSSLPPMDSPRFSEDDSAEGLNDGSDTDEHIYTQALLRDRPFPSDNEATAGIKHIPPKRQQSNYEFVREMLVETLPTLALSTVGLTITGQMVDVVANWRAMSRIDELFILIPVLSNMKGNLEMNLSSKLGTAAYLGTLDSQKSRKSIISGNILLIQIQALLVSCLAGAFSFVLSWLSSRFSTSHVGGNLAKRAILMIRDNLNKERKKTKPKLDDRPGFAEFIFVVCTSMTAASLSALSLGSFMCTLVVLCRRHNVNPDNVAPPIASALGDLVTLFLLAVLGTIFLPLLGSIWPILFTVALLGFLVGMTYYASLNAYVRPLLKQGWSPLVGAMLITSFAGLVLDQFVTRYEGYGLLAIVITGLPGGVGSVFVSRISTMLHVEASTTLPNYAKMIGVTDDLNASRESTALEHGSSEIDLGDTIHPISSGTHVNHNQDAGRLSLFGGTLFAVTFPVQILFLLWVHLVGWVTLTWTFVIVFMIAFSLTVLASLYLAKWLTHWLWARGLDPDMYAMPIQSSLVDLIAQVFLVASYELATLLGSDMYYRKPL